MATEQAKKKAYDVLNMLGQFLGGRKLKLDELYTLLISGLESADINLLPLGKKGGKWVEFQFFGVLAFSSRRRSFVLAFAP